MTQPCDERLALALELIICLLMIQVRSQMSALEIDEQFLELPGNELRAIVSQQEGWNVMHNYPNVEKYCPNI